VPDPLFRAGAGRGDPAEQAAAVHAFLVRCRAWATEREIPRRAAEMTEDPRADRAAALHAWISWRDFVGHALVELESGALDHWFSGPDNP
jgi:hypothetical protein